MSSERKRDVALYLLNQVEIGYAYIEAVKEIIKSMPKDEGPGIGLVIPSAPPDEHVTAFKDDEGNKLSMSWFPGGPVVAAVAEITSWTGAQVDIKLPPEELRKLGLRCLAVAESCDRNDDEP